MSAFVLPQSPAGAVPALFCVSPYVLQLQQQHNLVASAALTTYYNSQTQYLPQQFDVKMESYQFQQHYLYAPPLQHIAGPLPNMLVEPQLALPSPQLPPLQQNIYAGAAFGEVQQDVQTITPYMDATNYKKMSNNIKRPINGFMVCSKQKHTEIISSKPNVHNSELGKQLSAGFNPPNGTYFHPKFKTEMCNKYTSNSGCPYGDQCQFRHPEDIPEKLALVKPKTASEVNFLTGRQLLKPKTLTSSFPTVSVPRVQVKKSRFGSSGGKNTFVSNVKYLHPKFKTEICRKYDQNYGCPYGDQCQFLHPEDPIPSEPPNRRFLHYQQQQLVSS